jgi:cell division protein FtsI/penicillin-binding protein 2
MKAFALAAVFGAVVAWLPSIEAHPVDPVHRPPSYLLVSVATQEVIEAHWDDRDRPLAIGSLIKPFTALAYAETHRFTYPTLECRGSADGCWLPAGHGRVGLAAAIAGSCNAYFRQLAESTSSDALVTRLRSFGMAADALAMTPAAMVGFGEALKVAPSAVVRGFVELVARAAQPGVQQILEGLRLSALSGTGRGVGASIGAEALVKTGTAPCGHSPRATADGYTIVVYPADRPQVVLLVQAHGQTGAETAVSAGQLLARSLGTR